MDFGTTCCFGPCAVCQDANELMAREGKKYYIPKCSDGVSSAAGSDTNKVTPAAGGK